MAYIYPKKIQTTTGHSIKHATQKITNPNNLCSDSKALAYWGVKTPAYVGNYLRNYYDSITTISGSYYKPETIYATLWDIDNLPNDAIINNMTIQYKWEQVSYSCGTMDCYGRFEKPTISLITNDGKTIASFKGAKPDAIRYNNNQTNSSKMNTNSANLATLHSHTFSIPKKYNFTIKDLKNAKIKFDPAKNTYWNHCRIIMQFIRIKIDYTPTEKITLANPLPNYRIHKIGISPQSPTINCESNYIDYTYTCTIRTTAPYVKQTTCTIIPGDDVEIIEAPSNYNKSTNIWTVSNFTNYQATINLKCRSKTPGTKKIKTTINKYADSIQNTDERIFTVNKIENTLDWNVELDGEIQPYIYDGQSQNLKKCLKISINRGCDQSNRHENIIIDTQGWITDRSYWQIWSDNSEANNYDIEDLTNGKWKITNLRGHNITITTRKTNSCAPLSPGEYHITVTHEEDRRISETKSIDVYVTNSKIPMDYFKLRLEDGSDIKYNSLIFSLGDDLQFPLTYEPIKDNFIDNIKINGEIKHIPTNEARYITYTLKSDKTIKDVLCKIDVIGNRYVESDNATINENASEIIIGADNQVQILENGASKFCVIDEIIANEEKKIKFVVQSDIEQECTFKLLLLNYDEYTSNKWSPCEIFFEDIPNVKISIDTNKDELTTPDNDLVEIYYGIENKSNVDGKNIKFQLKEPSSFEIQNFDYNNESVKYILYSENGQPLEQQPFFNEYNRIITFPILPGQKYDDTIQEYITQKQILKVVYKATQKGIYDFTFNTYDDKNTFEDDQWSNSITKKIMVDISSNVRIKTSVNKPKPFLNELIDFKINAKNYTKKQNEFTFIIKDIGSYDQSHSKNDYNIEYSNFDKGMFVDGSKPAKLSISSNNNITQINNQIKLKATLINAKGNPIPNTKINFYEDWQTPSELLLTTDKDIIQKDEDLTIEATVLGDRQGKIPNETVKIYEGEGEIVAEIEEEINDENIIGMWTVQNIDIDEEFELVLTLRPQELGYHVIETTFIDGDGQIQTFTNIVNVFEPNKQIDFNVYHAVGVNENIMCNDFDNIIEICDDDYIDLDDTLFYICEITNNNRNTITDTTHIYIRLDDTFLTNNIICSTHEIIKQDNNLLHIHIPSIQGCQTVKVCFKIKPSEIGTFISNFMLTNRNAKIYHKNLTINVAKEFSQKQLEHEINIYNFEKTNHYFRYELDGNNNIFKFFNQGNDKSLKLVDVENYKQDSIETYKGSNLKKLLRDIANNSKYVEPELLRVGNNRLAPKGYEMYPDGFMRRFGLLNSEVFHYTGQLPTIGHLADKAMKWDMDKWDTKVWGGDIYDNGVFDLTIDYSKIPTNFDILDIDNPIKNLQALVDKTKPYGTQAICYYSAKLYLDLNIDVDLQSFEASSDLELPLKISDIGLISLYNRHDNSIAAFYDLFNIDLKSDMDLYEFVELSQEKDKQTNELKTKPYNNISLSTDMMLIAEVFDQQYSKKYINECFDIVNMIYSYNPSITNIDIVKDYNYKPTNLRQNFTPTPNDIFSFEYNDDDILSIITSNDKYNIKHIKEEFFNGFKIYQNDEELFTTNFYTNINNYNIQIQVCEIPNINDKYVVHIFCSINNQSYIHIGYIIINVIDNISIQPNNYTSYSYTTKDQKIKFRISDVIKTIKQQPKTIVQFDKTWKWNGIKNINTNNKYAMIENNIDIDKQCKTTTIKAPTLALKYNNINISDHDELVDIGVKLQAKTNKQNFINDLKINLYTNGDYYIPENNVARKTYYPQTVNNVSADYANTITIDQPNITICSNCLHTNIGFFDTCPNCGSSKISQYDEKKAVTVCRNPECGWIVDGWNDYCTHCLSEDVEKTKVDYNRTQCLNPVCNHIANDYYERCPKCFTTKVIHTNKNENKYTIGDNNSSNIDKIIIHSDINRVNLCNIEINTESIKKIASSLQYLNLHLYGHNYNDGKFYYCSECKKIGLGNVDKCPYCNNTEIVNYDKYNNVAIYVYYQVGDKIKEVQINPTYSSLKDTFDIPIDILSLVNSTNQASFKLLIYVENLSYDDVNNFIEKYEMDDDSYELFVNNIPIMNITLDNIYYEHKYIGEQDWQNIDKLETITHTGISYKTQNKSYTDYIRFSDFNIENEKYDHIYLNVAGINKVDQHINMEVIINSKDTNTHTIQGIQPNLFSEQIDLLEFINDDKINNIEVQLCFTNVQKQSEIILTHIYITTEKSQYKNILYGSTKQHEYNITQNNDTYIINTYDMFGLKNEHPYYVDGKLLDTNIVCYLDFGQLHNQEYVRLYDVELIVLYKNRYGKMITEHINIDNEQHTKQLANATMQTNNAEIWGSIKTSMSTLSNLESHIFTNTDEESLQSTPLKYGLTQAFTIITPNISQLILNYDGSIGYPSDTITVQIFDDNHNTPDNLLFSKDVVMPNSKEEINIDIDIDNLPLGQYWFKLIDKQADKNNYHKFNHNNKVDVGNLIIHQNENNYQYNENKVLSFEINNNVDIRQYYTTPTTLDLDGATDFKSCYTLYRYNTKSINNAYIQDIQNETGYLQYADNRY